MVATLVAGLFLAGGQAKSADLAELKARDGHVVSAALYVLLTRESQTLFPKLEQRYVGIRPDAFLGRKRGQFGPDVKGVIESEKRTPDRGKVRELQSLSTQVGHHPGKSPPVFELKALVLDPRIVLTDVHLSGLGRKKFKDGYWVDDPVMLRNREGKLGRLVLTCSLQPPCYSGDGQYALLRGSTSWSFHSACFNFVLNRTGDGWGVIVQSWSYDL